MDRLADHDNANDIILGTSSKTYTFVYGYDDTWGGVIQIEEYSNNVTLFNHYEMGLGHRPPQSSIDTIRPLMRNMEQRMIQQCDMPELHDVKERCMGVKCPALPESASLQPGHNDPQ